MVWKERPKNSFGMPSEKNIYIKIYLFPWKAKQMSEQELFNPLVYFLNCCNKPGRARPKPGVRKSNVASLTGSRGPSTWSFSPVFPGALAGSCIRNRVPRNWTQHSDRGFLLQRSWLGAWGLSKWFLGPGITSWTCSNWAMVRWDILGEMQFRSPENKA